MSKLDIPGNVAPDKDDEKDEQPFLGKYFKGRFSFSPAVVVALSGLNGVLFYELIKNLSCDRGLMACGWGGFGIIFPVYLPLMGFIGRMNLGVYVILFAVAAIFYNYIAYGIIRFMERKVSGVTAVKPQPSAPTPLALSRFVSQ